MRAHMGTWDCVLRGRFLSSGMFSREWNLYFPGPHAELLPFPFRVFIFALRFLHLQRLQRVVASLPPGPALGSLLQLDGALRKVLARTSYFVQGKPASGLFVPTYLILPP